MLKQRIAEKVDFEKLFIDLGFKLDRRRGKRQVVLCPFHDDEDPSCSVDLAQGLFHCFASDCRSNEGHPGGDWVRAQQLVHGGSPIEAMRVVALEHAPDLVPTIDRLYYSVRGMPMDGQGAADVLEEVAIEQLARECRERFATEAARPHREFLKRYRGWTDETLERWGIGWDGERYTIPVSNSFGQTVHLKLYNPRLQPKMKGISGITETRLFNEKSLAEPPSDVVLICEGETDAITAYQHGLGAAFSVVSSTAGSAGWIAEWGERFKDLRVWLVYDVDEAGREGARKTGTMLVEHAREVRDIQLPLDRSIHPSGDLSDWLRASEGDRFDPVAELRRLANDAGDFLPSEPTEIEWASAHCPSKWAVDLDGVHEIAVSKGVEYRRPLTTSPIWVCGFGGDAESGQRYVRVAYWTETGKEVRFLKRNDVLDRKRLLDLSAIGMPVNSENVTRVTAYFDACQRHIRGLLQPDTVSSRNGWVGRPGSDDQCERFVLGSRTFPEMNGAVHLLTADEDTPAEAFRPRGSLKTWIEIVRETIAESPQIRVMLYAACAAPFLRLLRVRSSIYHFFGLSSSGKTAGLKLAASVWFDPIRGLQTINTTQTNIERRLFVMSDLPTFLDELQVQPRKEFLNTLIYMIPEEQGKGRGRRDGGVQEISTWKTNVLITGEQPLIQRFQIGGQDARVIEIAGEPLASPERAERLHRAVEENFAHAGPILLRHLVAVDRSVLASLYDDAYILVKENLPTKLFGAGFSAAAAMLVGGLALHRWVLDDVDFSLRQGLAGIADAFGETESKEPYACRVYRTLRDLTLQYRKCFEEPRQREPGLIENYEEEQLGLDLDLHPNRRYVLASGNECWGKIPEVDDDRNIVGEVFWLRAALERALDRAGIQLDRGLLRELRQHEFLSRDGGTEHVHGAKAYVIRLRWLSDREMEQLGG